MRMQNMEAHYLNTSTDGSSEKYALMGVGFTKLGEKPAAKSKGKKYICDISETKTITGYEWSTPFETDQIKEEEAIKFIMDIGKYQKIGSAAETYYIKVDMDDPESGTSYKARKFKVAIEVDEFGNDDGQLTCKGNLLGKGDMVVGTFDVQARKFTPDSSTQGVVASSH